jgi:hypothetical protein
VVVMATKSLIIKRFKKINIVNFLFGFSNFCKVLIELNMCYSFFYLQLVLWNFNSKFINKCDFQKTIQHLSHIFPKSQIKYLLSIDSKFFWGKILPLGYKKGATKLGQVFLWKIIVHLLHIFERKNLGWINQF